MTVVAVVTGADLIAKLCIIKDRVKKTNEVFSVLVKSAHHRPPLPQPVSQSGPCSIHLCFLSVDEEIDSMRPIVPSVIIKTIGIHILACPVYEAWVVE